MGIGNGGVFLLYRVSYYNFSSLILFESMYLCRRIISGCTAIVDDYLFCSIVFLQKVLCETLSFLSPFITFHS
jgi:hypothetical protein